MAAVLLFWHANMAAVMMQQRFRKLIVIIIIINAFGAQFLQLYHKNEYGDPHFYFMILIRTVLPLSGRKLT